MSQRRCLLPGPAQGKLSCLYLWEWELCRLPREAASQLPRASSTSSLGKQPAACLGAAQGNSPAKPTEVCYNHLYTPCSYPHLAPRTSLLLPRGMKSPTSEGYGCRYKFLCGTRFVPAPTFTSAEARSPWSPPSWGKSSVHSRMCRNGLSEQSPWELAPSLGQSHTPGFGQQRTAASWEARAQLHG